MSDVWPEDNGSDTSNPALEFSEVDYDPPIEVPTRIEYPDPIIYAVVTNIKVKSEDDEEKFGYVTGDLYHKGLDEDATEEDVEIYVDSQWKYIVNGDILKLKRIADGYQLAELNTLVLIEITSLEGTGKYKAKKYKLFLHRTTDTLSSALTNFLEEMEEELIVYNFVEATAGASPFIVGDILAGFRAGKITIEDKSYGIVIPIAGGSSSKDTWIILGGASSLGGNRWSYSWDEAIQDVNGKWKIKPSGNNSSDWGPGYNGMENSNAATGTQGNGFVVDAIAGTSMLPIQSGIATPATIGYDCDGNKRADFSLPNGVTGSCS